VTQPLSGDVIDFLTGTASWTDPTLVKSDLFYPPQARTPAERLAFYAAHFRTVEVDATFYALPSERNAQLWASGLRQASSSISRPSPG
jgi:uncharacterized protein YecE (DUF72 family)